MRRRTRHTRYSAILAPIQKPTRMTTPLTKRSAATRISGQSALRSSRLTALILSAEARGHARRLASTMCSRSRNERQWYADAHVSSNSAFNFRGGGSGRTGGAATERGAIAAGSGGEIGSVVRARLWRDHGRERRRVWLQGRRPGHDRYGDAVFSDRASARDADVGHRRDPGQPGEERWHADQAGRVHGDAAAAAAA